MDERKPIYWAMTLQPGDKIEINMSGEDRLRAVELKDEDGNQVPFWGNMITDVSALRARIAKLEAENEDLRHEVVDLKHYIGTTPPEGRERDEDELSIEGSLRLELEDMRRRLQLGSHQTHDAEIHRDYPDRILVLAADDKFVKAGEAFRKVRKEMRRFNQSSEDSTRHGVYHLLNELGLQARCKF